MMARLGWEGRILLLLTWALSWASSSLAQERGNASDGPDPTAESAAAGHEQPKATGGPAAPGASAESTPAEHSLGAKDDGSSGALAPYRGLEAASLPQRVAGTWYEVDLDCPFCLEFQEHRISLRGLDTILEYADRMEIPDSLSPISLLSRHGGDWRGSAAFGMKHPKKDELLVIQYPEYKGLRASDLYARIWWLTPMADGSVLFGRRFVVRVFVDEAFETVEDGYRARASFFARDKLVANLLDVRVWSLSRERKTYQPAESVQFALDGAACFVREDAKDTDLARAYAEAQAAGRKREERVALYETLVRQGDQSYHAEDYEDALNRYKAASTLLPERPLVHANLGAVYQVRKRLPEAEAAYRMARSLNPGDLDNTFNLGVVLEQMGQYGEALECYRQVMEKRPRDLDAVERAAGVREKVGE